MRKAKPDAFHVSPEFRSIEARSIAKAKTIFRNYTANPDKAAFSPDKAEVFDHG
jgi:hypothetical protein